jgi:hypothetical protein
MSIELTSADLFFFFHCLNDGLLILLKTKFWIFKKNFQLLLFFSFSIFYSFIYMCIIVWPISSLFPYLLPHPHTPLLPGRICSALISNFVEERESISNNKKDKAF